MQYSAQGESHYYGAVVRPLEGIMYTVYSSCQTAALEADHIRSFGIW